MSIVGVIMKTTQVLIFLAVAFVMGRASTLVRPFGGDAPAELEITVEGDFGAVRIVGDDAESFLDAILPREPVRFEDTTGGENTSFDLLNFA
jgi:hypothetical protein